MSAINGDKCLVCFNLDPRGHPLASTFVVDGRILSSAQIQHVDQALQYTPNKQCGYCDLVKDAVAKFFPFWEQVKDDLALAMPKLTTITLIDDQPALLSVLHYVKGKRTYTNIELFQAPGQKLETLPARGALSTLPEDARLDATNKYIRVPQSLRRK